VIVVTGGAGFIGSAIAQELNMRGRMDLLIVDDIDHPEKEKNITSIKYQELRGKNSFLEKILDRNIDSVEVIIHMGACSSTTETDEKFLIKNNYHYTRHLATYALEKNIRFIYASSAATYGNGEMGYSDDESKLFMEELGIDSSGLDRLTHSGYRMLEQITYFTAGKQEVRAWEIRKGSTAPEAAGKIHTDFEKGFIRAEVFHFDDIDQLGSESSVKDAGRWRLEGRDYVVQDGDIMHFRFNV